VALFCSATSKSGEAIELAIKVPFGLWIPSMLSDSSRRPSIGDSVVGLEANKMKRGSQSTQIRLSTYI
jgi:hypothetical protein